MKMLEMHVWVHYIVRDRLKRLRGIPCNEVVSFSLIRDHIIRYVRFAVLTIIVDFTVQKRCYYGTVIYIYSRIVFL